MSETAVAIKPEAETVLMLAQVGHSVAKTGVWFTGYFIA